MRDKVKDLMAKLKKVRSYRHSPSTATLQRKTTSKVLILESRASSSRILHNSSRGSPLGKAGYNEPLSTAPRRLLFPAEERTCYHHCIQSTRSKSSGKRAIRGVSTKRAHSPEETPTLGKKHLSRVSCVCVCVCVCVYMCVCVCTDRSILIVDNYVNKSIIK